MLASVIDLFCGIGGLSHGFVLEGLPVVAGIDNDSTCRYAYEANNNGATFLEKSVSELDSAEISQYYPENHAKILVGCAPCQDFSKYSYRSHIGDKWHLLGTFADLITEIQPDIVSMENVPQLKRFQKGNILKDFISRLIDSQYYVTWSIVHCPDYGIPQNRDRLVLFASRTAPITIVPPTTTSDAYTTVRATIGNLPPIVAGVSHSDDPLHKTHNLSEINMERIKQSRPGGTWNDWDPELRAECHRKTSGKTYSSVYGRMEWDKVSPTMTTLCCGYGNGRFGHPEQDRAISVREAALLQTFPITYQFVPPDQPVQVTRLARQIGNAVPVTLGRIIARTIKNALG